MGTLTRGQLQFPYAWSAIPPDDARITGAIDGRMVNRGEGYEVLYFVNTVTSNNPDALKAERLLHNHVPGNLRSRVHIYEWMRDNWNAYN